jgi:hypothetical protein
MGFVVCYFFMEETMYYRGKNVEGAEDSGSGTPHKGDVTPPQPSDNYNESKVGITNTTTVITQEPVVYHPKTFTQKLKIFTVIKERPFELWKMMYRPLILLQFPVISWSGFQYGTNLCWFNVLNATAALILSGPPYNFKASFIGVAYIAPMIGVTVA